MEGRQQDAFDSVKDLLDSIAGNKYGRGDDFDGHSFGEDLFDLSMEAHDDA